jgi:integrase
LISALNPAFGLIDVCGVNDLFKFGFRKVVRWWSVCLFKIANLRREDGTPKRCTFVTPSRWRGGELRDTFAVEMLLAGVPLEQVSVLLGHKSVKITEKHYAPWVKARQELLAANVRKAWNVIQSSGKKSRRKQPQRVKTA